MSRDSAARSDSSSSAPSNAAVELASLDEGIAVLTRFEEVLAELEHALDSLSLPRR